MPAADAASVWHAQQRGSIASGAVPYNLRMKLGLQLSNFTWQGRDILPQVKDL